MSRTQSHKEKARELQVGETVQGEETVKEYGRRQCLGESDWMDL